MFINKWIIKLSKKTVQERKRVEELEFERQLAKDEN